MRKICKGLCVKYKAKIIQLKFRYKVGDKRCRACIIWLNYDGMYCPCCGNRLRIKGRDSRSKKLINYIRI